ncbi:stretch-activated Ca2+-permeable channel component-domain-containing protein [Aspergillus pseudotamarii]|uniref:Stretch-activated Ca2+-permeable channel component-domain-containing protein n=1 Tax=Aspergillus pseudotamarii TaxID=132259 RepID=A0A5N6SBY0_ASPPS|nr:stretch-activated Ca2+-permeable channel component-domain-containing protein [Aspergillus pseudotamarii]KAE8132212.1 stretch-activated Ca2+-permeable channel component-domain-containing protein [Aspergillus pseudotamarii]
MSESPKSEKYMFLSRFSTPVPELDDHRFQLGPPRIEATPDMTLSRQNTTPQNLNMEMPQRSDLLQIQDALREAGPFSRDFEQAISDDDRSVKDVNGLGRRFSLDPAGNIRQARTFSRTHQDIANLSRDSSVSARSTSPPNSVEAFADPRRRERANTLESHAAPDLEAILQRTVSGGTHPRRPTFSNASAIRPQPGDIQLDSPEDTCVPSFEQLGRIPVIDYEELEEFVALNQKIKPVTMRRKYSLGSQSKKSRVFYDLRPNAQKSEIHDAKRSSDDFAGHELKDSEEVFADAVNEKELVENLKNENEPTRFGFFSSESQSTVHAAELGDLVLPGDTFRDLFQLGPEGGVWWLDVLNPTEAEVGALSRAFSIHPLTTEDILTQEAREKVELFKQYYFVCFRTFYQMDKTSERFMEPVNFYMVVFRDGVLSFSFTENPHASNVRRRIGKLRDYVSLSSDWICYAMIDDIVDSFGPVIREIEVESEAIEDLVFIARMDDFESFLPRIGGLRKKVMSLMRLLGGKADVIRGFSKRCNEQYSVTPRGDIGLYLGDIQDHVVTMMSNLAHFEKMLSRSHTNYLAQLNVTNLVLGNHVNKILSKVTLIATMLVPMNLICGLFGMNVTVPGQGQEGLAWFFGIVGLGHAADLTSLVPEIHSNLTFNDGDSHFPFPLGSYNGLVVEDDVDDAGDLRGLDIVRRAPTGVSSLDNNQYQKGEVKLGETQWWYFPKNSVNGKNTNKTSEGPTSDKSTRMETVFISLTACSKPSSNKAGSDSARDLPHLEVYVSASESLQKPGSGQESSNQTKYMVEEGYMGAAVEVVGNVYIGVTAHNSTEHSGSYSYELAASVDAFFHSLADDSTFLYFVDSDTRSALFTTGNLTEAEQGSQSYNNWMDIAPPYTMFANNINDTAISGLHHSSCALDRLAQIGKGDSNIKASMTSRGPGNKPKEQLYITGLNQSSTYEGILVLDGNSTVSRNGVIGGGGKLWKPITFSTKADGNCALLYNLSFCNEVAYAVPSNPTFNLDDLRSIYDDNAAALYKNFSYSLEQIQCNATNETRFSLAVGCDDCARAYKQWLCAVTIPRCEDFSSTGTFLQVRNAGQEFINGTSLSDHTLRLDASTNRSRNSLIDKEIRPGPYKEILPCEDTCYNLVKSCPAALDFSCPQGRWLISTYGKRGPDDFVTCSWVGAAYFMGGGDKTNPLRPVLFALVTVWLSYWAFGGS